MMAWFHDKMFKKELEGCIRRVWLADVVFFYTGGWGWRSGL